MTRLLSLSSRWSFLIRQLAGTLACVVLLACMFAQVEIQIEGTGGWAANLPTWRIEQHWLLDVFWGGRAMTGYHAWVFAFMFVFFHFPMVVNGRYGWRAESHALGCVMLFWIVEDFLWFVLNPAYGLARFTPEDVLWHKRWLWQAPVEYWVFLPFAALLLWWSVDPTTPPAMTSESGRPAQNRS